MGKKEGQRKDKVSIFKKAVNFIGRVTAKKNKNTEIEHKTASKFEDFLKEIDPDDDMYLIIQNVANLCDDAIVIAREKLMLMDKLQVLNEEIKEIECYENLTDDDIEHLKDLLARFMSLTKDRNALRYQIVGFDKGLTKMENLEEDARFIVDNTEEAERSQRFLKHDLGYLEGERAELQYERENLINTQEFIYKFTIVLVVFFGVATTFLGFIHIFRGVSLFFPAAIMTILLIIIVTSILIFKSYIKKQLHLNLKKQYRAVELINKKTVVYAYYTNFLNFVYKKYNVRNAEKLKQNIKDYGNYKHLTTRFDAIRDMLYETENNIDNFLRDKGITNTSITTERFAKTVNIDDKRKYYKELTKEKEKLEDRLKELNIKHDEIWKDLVLLNEEDKTASKIIDRIIKRYIDEVSKLVNFRDEDINNTNKTNLDLEFKLDKKVDIDNEEHF